MNLLKKIWHGDREQYPRWRDEKGNFVGSRRLLINGSRATITGIARIALGVRPELPWISYDAIEMLREHLKPNSRVLEFGSGMSTIWYARNAGHVVSVEDNKNWFDTIGKVFRDNKVANITYSLAENAENYVNAGVNAGGCYDLIMVDGSFRSDCIRVSLPLLASGGIIYLDNSDKHSSGSGGDTRLAEELLLKYARENDCEVSSYSDFAPTQFFAQEGLCIKRPS
jgi:predicted O-methyltransferase YrrM